MTTPHIKITETHWLAACKKFTTGHTIMDVCNKAIEIALEEQDQPTDLNFEGLSLVEIAAKALEMEMIRKSDKAVQEFEMMESELEQPLITADEARALGSGGAEYLCQFVNEWVLCLDHHSLGRDPCAYKEHFKYRAVKPAAPTCQVQLIGGEVQTITREKAKALQAKTKDTHDWSVLGDFANRHYIEYRFQDEGKVYYYHPKAKKVIPLSSLPIGVWLTAINRPDQLIEFRGYDPRCNYVEYEQRINATRRQANSTGAELLTLAPASEQKWIAVQDGVDCVALLRELRAKGIAAECSAMRLRVIGIESGYVLGGN